MLFSSDLWFTSPSISSIGASVSFNFLLVRGVAAAFRFGLGATGVAGDGAGAEPRALDRVLRRLLPNDSGSPPSDLSNASLSKRAFSNADKRLDGVALDFFCKWKNKTIIFVEIQFVSRIMLVK